MSEIYLLLSVIAAALPVLCYLVFVWWLDRYEREPLWLVGLTFFYGATGAIFLGVYASAMAMALLAHAGVSTDMSVTAGLIAPLCEEPAKGLFLLGLLVGKNFDNTTDGLVYGAAVGLGFAMTENFFYFLGPYSAGDVEAWTQLVVIRGLFSALMHASASATLGATLGYFRYRNNFLQWVGAPALGLAVAICIHAAFNNLLTLTVRTGDEQWSVLALAIVPVIVAVLFAVTQLALFAEHKMIQRELEHEAYAGVLPYSHALIIPFAGKRKKDGWLPPNLDKAEYIKTATLLAFRRHQARLRGTDTGSKNREIHALRMKLTGMLERARMG